MDPSISRFKHDFDTIVKLGSGGYGIVYLVTHKLDKHPYAVKIMKLTGNNCCERQMAVREVETMAKLNHPNIVRYHQAWLDSALDEYYKFTDDEEGDSENSGDDEEVEGDLKHMDDDEDEEGGSEFSDDDDEEEEEEESDEIEVEDDSEEKEDFKFSDEEADEIEEEHEKEEEADFLCIQMEFCRGSLHEVLEPQKYDVDEVLAIQLFRQMVEGLDYLHRHMIIHRDLNPLNIFIDTHKNIKIGDFGLACSLNAVDNETKMEDLALSVYRAPEMNEHVTEKVDMYSLGVILFQLYFPFGSDMERHLTLEKLTKEGEVDNSKWVKSHSKQFALIKMLLSSDPNDRPSARRVLDVLIGSHL